MEFQIGQMWLKFVAKKAGMVVLPIGNYMVAINIEMFDKSIEMFDLSMGFSASSMMIQTNIYHKHDLTSAAVVQKWMRELDE